MFLPGQNAIAELKYAGSQGSGRFIALLAPLSTKADLGHGYAAKLGVRFILPSGLLNAVEEGGLALYHSDP
jgi:hypothetical protein